MWFGTKDRLNKYDGCTFTVYRHDPEDAQNPAVFLYNGCMPLTPLPTEVNIDSPRPNLVIRPHLI